MNKGDDWRVTSADSAWLGSNKMADEPDIELINDKWQNILPQYQRNWFDLAIVDPPYLNKYDDMKKISVSNKANVGNYHYNTLENNAPKKPFFDDLMRVSKQQIIWGWNNFTEYLEGCPSYIVWDKDNTGNFADSEIAWYSKKGAARTFKWRWNGMLQEDMKNKEKRIHPTQKPVALYKWLLENYANEGDKILDTHLGSGSSAIAAWQKKYDFVGIECDKEYFDDMLHRFKMNTDREYALESWQKQSESEGQQTIFSNQ